MEHSGQADDTIVHDDPVPPIKEEAIGEIPKPQPASKGAKTKKSKAPKSGVTKPKTKRSKAPKSGITRPKNCWLLFLAHKRVEVLRENPTLLTKQVSRIVSRIWKALSAAEKAPWKAEAKRLAEQHKRDNPTYKYQPRRPSEIKRRSKN
ncbi:hypothetical protein SLS62_010983 [Diatrype stigma]|uniref:HMG box domain-containing protein n=1 Tax=Diatrype stigma TaxID=117547 RepID=A0AAN9UDJ8_9PEZI